MKDKVSNLRELLSIFVRDRMELLCTVQQLPHQTFYSTDQTKYLSLYKQFVEIKPLIGAWVWVVACGTASNKVEDGKIELHHRTETKSLVWYDDELGMRLAVGSFVRRLEDTDWEMVNVYDGEKGVTIPEFIKRAAAGFTDKSMEIHEKNQKEHPGQYSTLNFIRPEAQPATITRADTMKKQIVKPMTVSRVAKILDMKPADVLVVAAACVTNGRTVKHASNLSVEEAHAVIDKLVHD